MEKMQSETLLTDLGAALKRTFAALLVLGVAGCATSAVDAGGTNGVTPVPVAGVYRGTLGPNSIELVLKLDETAEDSVDGWYVPLGVAPSPANRVLVAGEFEKNALSMEESRNGVDVSGTWSATLSDGALTGTWSDAEGESEMPVMLKRIVGAPTPEKP
jgi:hypothetical protein